MAKRTEKLIPLEEFEDRVVYMAKDADLEGDPGIGGESCFGDLEEFHDGQRIAVYEFVGIKTMEVKTTRRLV